MLIDEYRELVESFHNLLLSVDADLASKKPSDGTWSLKEIVGHLIDSASNNHQRYVRLIDGNLENFPTYNASIWAKGQNVQDEDWNVLSSLWYFYNRHLLHVISVLPEESLENEWMLEKDLGCSLEWIIEDYYRHLQHHIDKFIEKYAKLLS